MQPYALYGLLPHYSLGLEIVVAYAKALNSSTLTSSLLWSAKAAMRLFLAFIPFVRANSSRSKAQQGAPHERILVGNARRTSCEASRAVHISGASCQGLTPALCGALHREHHLGKGLQPGFGTARRHVSTGAASDRSLTPSSSSLTPLGAALGQ